MPSKSEATKKRSKVHFGTKCIEIEGSSLINHVFYDPETNTLDAVFKKGSRYRYRGVSPKVFAQFVLAKSMGNFFNTKIRSKFQYQPVLKA